MKSREEDSRDETRAARIRTLLTRSIEVKQQLLADAGLIAATEALAGLSARTLESGCRIIFAGNGGSFADAQHLATEFASRFVKDRRPLAAFALGTNGSAISAIANDYGFDQVFAREITALGSRGDLFVPISTSGSSSNILAAVQAARQKGLAVFGLTGASGGQLASLCDCIRVPSEETPRIQECHILLGHIICDLTERQLFADL